MSNNLRIISVSTRVNPEGDLQRAKDKVVEELPKDTTVLDDIYFSVEPFLDYVSADVFAVKQLLRDGNPAIMIVDDRDIPLKTGVFQDELRSFVENNQLRFIKLSDEKA